MPQESRPAKHERSGEHIKNSLTQRGKRAGLSAETATRSVNTEYVQYGRAKRASRSATHDLSAGRCEGLHGHEAEKGRTYEQLYHEARTQGLKGRSGMSKAELVKALGR